MGCRCRNGKLLPAGPHQIKQQSQFPWGTPTMNANTVKLIGAASLLTLISLVLVSGGTSQDDSLQRISNYKNWARVTQQVPIAPTNPYGDLATAGG
jgi:hypothetical protein